MHIRAKEKWRLSLFNISSGEKMFCDTLMHCESTVQWAHYHEFDAATLKDAKKTCLMEHCILCRLPAFSMHVASFAAIPNLERAAFSENSC